METGKFVLLATILLGAMSSVLAKAETIQKINRNIDKTFSISAFNKSQQLTPDALLRDLYKVHGQKNSNILSNKSRKLLDKYFDRNLANLIWKDLTTHRNEYGVIDFDIFYNTQDPLIKNVSVAQPKIKGANATVSVSFSNSGVKEIVVYTLVRQNGAWKISDIKYRNGDTLLKYFEEGV
jgi:ABC-type transporter MlaC component